nr:BRO family protein [Cohaesibacter haloalkalitolerans]
MEIQGEPWFVAADVCKALDLPLAGGAGRYLQNIDSDEKKTLRRTDCNDLFVGVRAPSYLVISESCLYKLILRSDKPQAKQFQDWVTRDVLPAIRKTGSYVTERSPQWF